MDDDGPTLARNHDRPIARSPTAPLVVSFGEIVWDEVELSPEANLTLGGSAYASALHASALGANARLVSAVGSDEFGERARGEIRKQGLTTEWVQVRSGSKTARVHVTVSEDGPRYAPIARFDWESVDFQATLNEALRGADALMFAVFLQGTPAPLAVLRGAFEQCARPPHVGCDLNLRHSLEKKTLEELRTLVDFVKLNQLELERARIIIGESDVAGFFFEQSQVRFVVESRGAEGASVRFRDGGLEVPAPAGGAPERSVGAGDALMASLTVALCRGEEPSRALADAVRYASALVLART
jgi:sugar/nucleoside kinase (ribokinase family)